MDISGVCSIEGFVLAKINRAKLVLLWNAPSEALLGGGAPFKATELEAFMADEQKPKKVGVYDGPGAAAGLNWTWIVIGLIVLAVVIYLLMR
ncbi:hypothetical protein [Azospirillum doebereinerae]